MPYLMSRLLIGQCQDSKFGQTFPPIYLFLVIHRNLRFWKNVLTFPLDYSLDPICIDNSPIFLLTPGLDPH